MNDEHAHEWKPALGIFGEPAKICDCGAYTIGGQVIEVKR